MSIYLHRVRIYYSILDWKLCVVKSQQDLYLNSVYPCLFYKRHSICKFICGYKVIIILTIMLYIVYILSLLIK